MHSESHITDPLGELNPPGAAKISQVLILGLPNLATPKQFEILPISFPLSARYHEFRIYEQSLHDDRAGLETLNPRAAP